ncbi:putative ribosomally synthesized peptide with SipW-like signal peptide [Neobacillus niacini]|jgi:predicted ribosomally synthesized peptide with SipW-like signal peptide|uniref:TasA family protein n=1 Tax=Neobacillus niacini TaxID=86668 RepID=UPI002781F991|nr:TasA family protein [Neobacillus niacini]MDQ1001882.1 putative ribosomally synthesized peptide with SipW-like signal peptide [Neobacillus niacini]
MSLKKKMGAALLTTAMGAALIGGGTFALFTDAATNKNNTFSAGTLDINVSQTDIAWTNEDGSINVPFNNLAPGDKGELQFDVTNNGTLELRYDVSGGYSDDADATTPSFIQNKTGEDLVITVSRSIDGQNWTIVTPANEDDVVMAPNAVIKYKVNYSFPEAAGNTYQKAAGQYQLTFNAEQTRNN